ncbi:conserved unknown protein [Ectocarpus siliculosus]|uniref:SANT domain-containing protein n=1 Tax=Ectocarpus siliculosus TaxID=2880 RepID=D7G878_ECTSI|nr:conserved unknown protein [Ectocarpus siliculosus]|eukprot:CBJ27941.1 conserved unknown protein [Ectocarpus siliculosus]
MDHVDCSFEYQIAMVPFNCGTWTDVEHQGFLRGLEVYGYGNCDAIGIFVPSRSPLQIEAYAQWYFAEGEAVRHLHQVAGPAGSPVPGAVMEAAAAAAAVAAAAAAAAGTVLLPGASVFSASWPPLKSSRGRIRRRSSSSSSAPLIGRGCPLSRIHT